MSFQPGVVWSGKLSVANQQHRRRDARRPGLSASGCRRTSTTRWRTSIAHCRDLTPHGHGSLTRSSGSSGSAGRPGLLGLPNSRLPPRPCPTLRNALPTPRRKVRPPVAPRRQREVRLRMSPGPNRGPGISRRCGSERVEPACSDPAGRLCCRRFSLLLFSRLNMLNLIHGRTLPTIGML